MRGNLSSVVATQAYIFVPFCLFLYNIARLEPFIVSKKVNLINYHVLTLKFLMMTCGTQVKNTVRSNAFGPWLGETCLVYMPLVVGHMVHLTSCTIIWPSG